MHIQKVSAGNEFYAKAWCGKKLGLLDRYYATVDNALNAIDNKKGEFPCPQCLEKITQIILTSTPSTPQTPRPSFETQQ